MSGHIATIHENKKLSKCEVWDCSNNFMSSFDTHVESVHAAKKCEICGHNSSKNSDEENHALM